MHSEIENERFTLHISTSSIVADGISHVSAYCLFRFGSRAVCVLRFYVFSQVDV